MKRTTKAALIGLASIVAFAVLVGCRETSATMAPMRYCVKKMDFRGPSEVFVDPETGVQYIVFDRVWRFGGGLGITPRLGADGKPKIDRSKIDGE